MTRKPDPVAIALSMGIRNPRGIEMINAAMDSVLQGTSSQTSSSHRDEDIEHPEWRPYCQADDGAILDAFAASITELFETLDTPVPKDTDARSAQMLNFERDHLEDRILACASILRKTRQFEHADSISSCLEDALAENEIVIDSFGGAWERLMGLAVDLAANHVLDRRAEAARLQKAIASTPAPAVVQQADPGDPISKIFGLCIADLNGGEWREGKSDRDARLVAKRIIEVLGDKPIGLVTRKDAAMFKRTIAALPAQTKRVPYNKLNIAQSIELRRKLAEREVTPSELSELRIKPNDVGILAQPTSARNLQKQVSFAFQLFEWARSNGELLAGNPFTDQHVPDKAVKADITKRGAKRKGFSREEKERIFSSPAFTGFQSENYRHRPGTMVKHDAKFWWPLLVCATGGRSEEIAALKLEDVCLRDGIWVLNVTPHADRLLKNKESERLIPIHSQLIEIGFSDYVADQRARGNTMLFPDLRPNAQGSYSDSIGDWFGRYLTKIGVKEKGQRLHAFRRSMITEVIDAGATEVQAALVAGHEFQTITMKEYHDEISLSAAKAVIEKIHVPVSKIHAYKRQRKS